MSPEGMALLLTRLDAIEARQTQTLEALGRLQGRMAFLVDAVRRLDDGDSGDYSEDEVSSLLEAGHALNRQVKVTLEQSEPHGAAGLLMRADRLELERLSREWFEAAKEVKL